MDWQGLLSSKVKDAPVWLQKNVNQRTVAKAHNAWIAQYRAKYFSAGASKTFTPVLHVLGGLLCLGYLTELSHIRAHAAQRKHH
eukprot:CFRG6834T1